MKELLEAVVSALKARGDFGDRVFITEAQEFVPPGLKTPAAGVKDGVVVSEDLTGGRRLETLEVHVFVYGEAVLPGQALLGAAGSSKPGVLALAGKVRAILDHNLLTMGPGNLVSARVKEIGESISWQEPARVLTSKYLTLVYEREN